MDPAIVGAIIGAAAAIIAAVIGGVFATRRERRKRDKAEEGPLKASEKMRNDLIEKYGRVTDYVG